MQETYLSIPKETWDGIFMFLRYGVTALIIAYLTSVYVKQKKNIIDLKGEMLERRIDSYKEIHRWAMQLKRVVADPSQMEQYYQNFLGRFKFERGYQGMEYCSIFYTPERFMTFFQGFKKLMDSQTLHLDAVLEQELNEFRWWLDDIIAFFYGFMETGEDPRWHFSQRRQEKNMESACHLMGIALQKDVNAFYDQFDRLLRNRLQKIRIANITSNSWPIRLKIKLTAAFEKKFGEGNRFVDWVYDHLLLRTYGTAQVHERYSDIRLMLGMAHFHEELEKPQFRQNQEVFMRAMR